jgi:hypothetical protein
MYLLPGCYWVDNGGNEPEPALWDGTAWALLGVTHSMNACYWYWFDRHHAQRRREVNEVIGLGGFVQSVLRLKLAHIRQSRRFPDESRSRQLRFRRHPVPQLRSLAMAKAKL